MSALDLFASGMGAFILLTVMALPFFPNTGDSEERLEEIKGELVQARAERDETKGELARALAERDAALSRASGLERVLAQIQTDSDVRKELQEALNDALRQIEDAQKRVQGLEEALAKAKEPTPEQRDAEERKRSLEEALAEARKQRDNAEKRAQGLEDALAKARMPDLDIVICLDVTASMTEQIEGLKREISALAEILDGLAPSAGIGVIAFGDRVWRQPVHLQPIVLTSDLTAVELFVRSLRPNMDPTASNNRDGPEAVATALESAVRMNWRAASQRRYVIAVTDNAAYSERERFALRTAREFAVTDGQFVSTVRANFTDNRRDREAADRFLRQLAAAGKGQFVDAAGGESMIGSLLLAIIGT